MKAVKRILRILLRVIGVLVLAYLLLTLILVVHLRLNGSSPDADVSETVVTYEEYGYGESDGLAFVASVTNEGPFMWDEDCWQTAEYSMHYDGTLEITRTYSLSGEHTDVCHISEADFNSIMSLAQKVMDEKPYEDMDYSKTMDGSTWGFTVYDMKGEATYIYGGYTYGIDDLESIEDILISNG